MKDLKVGIVACASMHEQIRECLASLEGSFRIYPIIPSCTFYVKINLIRHYLDKSLTENDLTLLAYGMCHPHLLSLLAEYGDHVIRTRGSNCYEMFLGSEKYSEYHRRCYWMLNKPFFTKWKNEILTGFGAGTSNGRVLIGDTLKKLVYVKFGNDELSVDLVEDFARTAGLEYEIHPADTANFKRLLEETLSSAYSARRVKMPKPSLEYPHDSEIRTIIESIGEVIYKVAVHTKQFTFVSPQVKRILGHTQAEFLGIMNDYLRTPFYHENDKQRVVAGRYNFLVKCLNEGMQEAYEAEYCVKHKNGDDLWVRESIYPSYTSDGVIESFVGKIMDITEQKRAEEMLRASEQKLRLTFESIAEGISVTDLQGNFTQVNETAVDLYGYDSKEDLIGRNALEFIAKKDRNRAIEQIKETLEVGSVKNIDYTFVRKDGSEFDAELSAAVIRDVSGNPIGIVGITSDIAKRRRAEEALRESQQNFRNSLDNSPLGIRIVTAEGELLYVNQAILDIYGFSSVEEMKAVPVEKRYTPQSYAEYQERKEKRKLGKPVPPNYEVSIVRKDGEVRHLAVFRKEVIWDGETQFQVLYQDITERRRAEEEVREERDRAQRYLDVAGVILVAINADHKVSLVNKKGCEILEYEEKEIIGKNWFDTFIPERDRDEVKGVFERLIAGEIEPVEYFENPVLTRSGEERIIAWHNALLKDKEGNIIATLSSGEDITERKQAEKALRSSEENFRALAENARDGIVIAASNGELLYANRRAAQICGYGRRELSKNNINNNIHPSELKTVADSLKKRLAGKRVPRRYETLFVRKSGSSVPVELTVAKTIWQGETTVLAIFRDISEQKRLKDNMQFYIAEVTRGQEAERKRIARELHDDTVQSLALLSLEIDAIREKEGLTEELVRRLEQVRARADRTLETTRRFIEELRPDVLDQRGLMPALQSIVKENSVKGSIDIQIEVIGVERRLSPEVEAGLFRIAQETLSNIRKHSQATEAKVKAVFTRQKIKFMFTDNGKGFVLPKKLGDFASRGKLGLCGMLERARLLDGKFLVKSRVGRGTTIVVEVGDAGSSTESQ